MTASMKIAVIGCGAMGAVYAARLARAGNEVAVVDRWADHVRAIETDGLQVEGPDGLITARVGAHTRAPDGPVDLVVIAVKAADAAAAATDLGGLVGADTTVVTIQNGLGAAEDVAEALGEERLLVGIAKGFGAALTGPGRAHHNAMRALRFGAYTGTDTQRAESVAAVWRAAGFDAEAVDDIAAMQWEKLICNVAYSGPCAVAGLTVGEVVDHPRLGPISRAAAREAYAAARAHGIALDFTDPVALVRDFAAGMPAAVPSVSHDIEAGRASEIDFINGAVPRAAGQAGLEAPVNAALTALVHAVEEGGRAPDR